jgi:hypothetical protein
MTPVGKAVVQFLGSVGLVAALAPPVAGVARADQPSAATGHVEFVNFSGNDVAYSFSAVNQPNGRVAGEVEAHIHRANGEFVVGHATTTCVTITGNIARVGALLDSFTVNGVPDQSGVTDLFFTVVDNGEGADAPPDTATNLFVGPPGTAARHCETGIFRLPFAVTEGNVQVRD